MHFDFDFHIHFARNISSRGSPALVARVPQTVSLRTTYFACAKSPRRFGSIKILAAFRFSFEHVCSCVCFTMNVYESVEEPRFTHDLKYLVENFIYS